WDLKEGSTYDYTVQETIYIDGPITDVGYNTDRAFVHVTIPKPGATTGTLTVTVLDNLKALPVSIRLFKDGQVYQDTVYLTGGTKTFSNLPFGTYNVQVLRDDYNVFFYDAFPAQSGYDYSTGKVQLSTTVNTCNYMIYGITDQTKADGSSGFDSGTDQIPGVDDAKESIRDIIFGDGDSGLSKIILFGLPLFMIIIIAGLGFYYYKLGDSKNGKK
ncbi:MAG TPA: hypothetical protein DCG34_08820, partial [Clostridiales bacterium]|nr:hypothetical protein [Clostridiales bacterium]